MSSLRSSSHPVTIPSRPRSYGTSPSSGVAGSPFSFEDVGMTAPVGSITDNSLRNRFASTSPSTSAFSYGSLRSGVSTMNHHRRSELPSINADFVLGNVPSTSSESLPLLMPQISNINGDSQGQKPADVAFSEPVADGGTPAAASRKTVWFKGVLFGLINSVILIPVIVSFAQIIFRHEYFTPSMPYLVKLVLLSSIVHQACFTIFSSLPFAIGQVQDAGLIFLSSMSSSIVMYTKAHDCSHAEIMATVLCWLGLSTALLGGALFLTGKLKLAGLVQYLPMPVVGGYLAFIGFYCLEAALSLMSGEEIATVKDLGRLFHKDALILCTPGVLTGIAMMLIVRRFRHFAVLPCCLLAIPVIFHIVLAASGVSIKEAQSSLGHGWLAKHTPSTKFWDSWEHYDFRKVQWGAIPAVIPTWFAMYFVVSFSSCLDVAAIQMELGSRLDFNHELKTVGISNMVSGTTGGFSGSYIFSQTIFTMRSKVNSRIIGITIIAVSLIFFFLPISVLEFIPKFFFGAILTFIAFDLMEEWLIHSYRLLRPIDYAVVWATFFAILGLNLEYGMLVGIGIAILVFLFQYSRVKVAVKSKNRSNVIRGFRHRQVLAQTRESILCLRLDGFIFFGSAVQILKDVKNAVLVPAETAGYTGQGVVTLAALESPKPVDFDSISTKLPTKFLVLDLSRVTGLDATAVRSCFVSLDQELQRRNINVLYTGASAQVSKLLMAHGLIAIDDQLAFETLDEGVQWCENFLLSAEGVLPHRMAPGQITLEDILRAYYDEEEQLPNVAETAKKLEPFFELRQLAEGEKVFSIDDAADSVFFIVDGEVTINRHVQGHSHEKSAQQRLMRIDQGGVFGQLEFFLKQPRVAGATSVCSSALLCLHRTHFDAMVQELPELAAIVQKMILKSVCMTVTDQHW